ncbi:S-formylglutathione hydrolase [Polymorphobacter multimanifer]|uniref:S-formylglutathione hydrolase n=1 Tax=Polymorphobacter multimanifer TaxID=1070431 RepID=A0A841L5T6_9SPHN|nr:S-formylglutathione hydrolase [Polymorphobacter multimanifer]MBB6228289.1 S-formylglutathione hydrolase [Polymorphobacter multimanifer]GGI91843.1 S-formylglutathione hydrolase [Polymorphobacter multimanifer]
MIETLASSGCHGGRQSFHAHQSRITGTPMRFGLFVPAHSGPRPVLWCLAGLTCTEETFAIKAGAQRFAADHGLILVTPDTSPRNHAGGDAADDGSYDLGQGAGFWLDATQAPWAPNYRMASWLLDEMPEVLLQLAPADLARQSIMGHSMGGHGALTLALKHPKRFRSVSAFAPICAPSEVPWGEKAFGAYLGDDRAAWAAHDACALIAGGKRIDEILVDQGMADQFLEAQLRPERLEAACARAGITLRLRRRAGYDHGYWFIQTFIEDHIAFHAERLA